MFRNGSHENKGADDMVATETDHGKLLRPVMCEPWPRVSSGASPTHPDHQPAHRDQKPEPVKHEPVQRRGGDVELNPGVAGRATEGVDPTSAGHVDIKRRRRDELKVVQVRSRHDTSDAFVDGFPDAALGNNRRHDVTTKRP